MAVRFEISSQARLCVLRGFFVLGNIIIENYSYLRKVASKSSSYILIALAQTRNSVLGYFYKGSKKVAMFLYVKCLSAI